MGIDPVERNSIAFVSELRERLAATRRATAASGTGATSIEDAIGDLIEREAPALPAGRRAALARLLERETIGLGPLEELMADPLVEEIMVNGHDRVYVERAGRVSATAVRFAGPGEVRAAIERILAPTGRRVDELSPMADARLADGSRVNVVVPPLAVDGPAISIRRFGADRPGPEELRASGSLPPPAAAALEAAVRARRTVLVSGGTGSGKTTLLNALSAWIAPAERVITIEDAAELRLRQPHVVRLESRPASVEGRGAVTMRDLLRNALRMRPDRIVIGEVRGPEALDLLTALNTGHEGALSTVHANSPGDALRRLETLVLMAGAGLPADAIREQLARGIDIVAHVRREPGGERRVTEVAEVVSGGSLAVRDVWRA